MLSGLVSVDVYPITVAQARRALDSHEWESVVGHTDTAKILGSEIGVEIPFNRATITLEHGSKVLVGQYRGPRLAEGTTSLPEGASIQWIIVEVKKLEDHGLNTVIDPISCPYCGSRDCGALHGDSVCS